jgi:DNA-dependent RNA polymerase auxiliary subunit epsilon
MSEKPWADEDLVLDGWELRDDGWYYMEKGGSAVRVLPYFRIRGYYIVGREEKKYVELVNRWGKSYIREVKRRKDTDTLYIKLVRPLGLINRKKLKEAREFLADYIEKVREERDSVITFLGYRYEKGIWEIVVGGDGKHTRQVLSFLFHGKEDLTLSYEWFLPSVEGDLETFKETYRKLFALNDPPLHFAIAHFLSWIAKQFLKESSVVPQINPVLILAGNTGTGKTIRAEIAAGLYGNPRVFSFISTTLAAFIKRFPVLEVPFGIDDISKRDKEYENKLLHLVSSIASPEGVIKVPVIMTVMDTTKDRNFTPSPWLSRRSIVIKLTEWWKSDIEVLGEAVYMLHSHHGHILHYVKGLTEKDRQWIERTAHTIYRHEKLQRFEGTIFEDVRVHIALSLAAFAHFFLHFIQACTEEEMNRKLAGIIDFVVEEIARNQTVSNKLSRHAG